MTQESSDTWQDLDETELAALTACHCRGSLNASELTQLLTCETSDAAAFDRLISARLLEIQGGRYRVTQS